MKQRFTDNLIKKLKFSVAIAEKECEDMNSISWGMQEGILISYNEAKEIIKIVETSIDETTNGRFKKKETTKHK